MKFELKTLLLEQRFGSIRLGDSLKKVVRLLGAPDNFSSSNRELTFSQSIKESTTLKQNSLMYGTIEFWFSFGELTFLYSDHFDMELEFREERYFDPWVLQKGLCLKEFLKTLKEEEIHHTMFQNMMAEEDLTVEIYFSEYTSVIFSAEPIIQGQMENGKMVTRVIPRPCPELIGFYLFSDVTKPETRSYLKPITLCGGHNSN
jgi:hypothetical protein